MAMSLAGSPHQRAQINVTPLIDVLLVLLIIFMVIVPLVPVGLSAAIPQPPDARQAPSSDDIVITVEAAGIVRLNQEIVTPERLAERLRMMLGSASMPAVFVRARKGLDFAQVAEVIDIAKGAGFDRVGLMSR